MSDRMLGRLGALSGIGFVVLIVIGTFLYPQQPRIDSSPATTLAWVHAHRSAISTGMILGVFAIALFVWFASHLRDILAESGAKSLASVVFGSGIASAVVGTVGLVPLALLAFMDGQTGTVDASSVRLVSDLGFVLFGAGAAVTALFLLGVGLAALRGVFGGQPVGVVSIVAAAFNCVAVVAGLTFTTYHGVGWAIPLWGSFIGEALVVLAVSVHMLRSEPSMDEAVVAA
jgi:hypothetical protein